MSDSPASTGSGRSQPPSRKWLCIAYAFPPINRSGTHRTLGFVQHLHELGWQAAVLSVLPDGESLDDSLMRRVPPGTEIIRTRWIDPIRSIKRALTRLWPSRPKGTSQAAAGDAPTAVRPLHRQRLLRAAIDTVTRLLQTPDSRIGWIPFAVCAGLSAIRRLRPDVLYSTSPYASAHLTAWILNRCTGIVWVADFRDPWCKNPFRTATGLAARWDKALEGIVLRHAAQIICNTPTAWAELIARRPRIASKCVTIMNGFDAEAFASAKPVRTEPPDRIVFAHCGQFYGTRSPNPWFQALARLRRQDPGLAARIRFLCIGGTRYDGTYLAEIADGYGVADLVQSAPAQAHENAIGLMMGSDVLVLAASAGQGGELQIPNKIYEYLAARRPILAAAVEASPVRQVLREARADCLVCEPADVPALAAAIKDLATRPPPDDLQLWSEIDRYDRRHAARELAGVFDRLRTQATTWHATTPVPA